VSVTLQEQEYFVLGDNRAASSDSRSWGSLSADAIIGRAWIRAFPVERFDVLQFERPGFLEASL
jgi:signal peptidase I